MGTLRRALGDVLGLGSRPPNAFMWKGEREPFYNRWWLKVVGPEGDVFSIQVVVNNPWDEDGVHLYTGVSIFFDRFSSRADKNLMSMPSWPLGSFSAKTDRFEVRIGDNLFTDRVFRGAFRDDHHDKDISFELAIEPTDAFLLRHAGLDGFSRSRVVNTLWQAPLASCRVSGQITIDDEVIELGEAPGYQDTFWGPSVPDRWFWGQCNKFDEDSTASIVIAAGQLELFGAKFPRFLDADSFPMLIAVRHGGEQVVFKSVLSRIEYIFDKGKIRIDARKRFGRTRVVYESQVPREDMRPMDWHSPDDTVLESGMTLRAPARLEIYRRGFLGPWRLETTLTTEDAGSICGGAKMDRISQSYPFLKAVLSPIAQLAYVLVFFLRGLFSRAK